MSDGSKIFWTVVTGILAFVISQFIQRWLLEPLQEQRRLIGRIASALTMYRAVTGDLLDPVHPGHPDPKRLTTEVFDASNAIMKLAADIHESLAVIPFYRSFEVLHFAWKRDVLIEVEGYLKLWQAYMRREDIEKAHKEITRLLKLKPMRNTT